MWGWGSKLGSAEVHNDPKCAIVYFICIFGNALQMLSMLCNVQVFFKLLADVPSLLLLVLLIGHQLLSNIAKNSFVLKEKL